MPTNVSIAGNNTAAQFLAADPNALPTIWERGYEIAKQEENFFQQFEGKGEMSPIQLGTPKLAAEGGLVAVFRTLGGVYGDGVLGSETLFGKGEKLQNGSYSLKMDFVRNAIERNRKLGVAAGAVEESLASQSNIALGMWMGRKKTNMLMMMFRERGNVGNTLYINGRGGRDAIRSADTLTMDSITQLNAILSTGGAKPAITHEVDGEPVLAYILVSERPDLAELKKTSDYKSAQRYAEERGVAKNTTFKGGYIPLDGNHLVEKVSLDHGGAGPIGSPFYPKALLGEAVTLQTANFQLKGGGTAENGALTEPKYFEFFSNYAYRFTEEDVLSPSGNRYCMIYNLTGVDAGKVGFYRFTTNNGNQLTITQVLVASTATPSGIQAATVGSLASGTSAGAGVILNSKITNAHPIGSVIIETNAAGVPIGRALMMGACAARRGYGLKDEFNAEKLDGGHITKSYIAAIFGQSPVKRPGDGALPNFGMIEFAASYPGLALPAIT